MALTPSMIRYLLTIYSLSDGGNPVRSVDVSRQMSVTRSSVVKTLRALTADGMIEKEYYGDIRLTAVGIQSANRLYTQVTILAYFFRHHLGVSADTALKDAITCTCVLSKESLAKLTELPLPSFVEEETLSVLSKPSE